MAEFDHALVYYITTGKAGFMCYSRLMMLMILAVLSEISGISATASTIAIPSTFFNQDLFPVNEPVPLNGSEWNVEFGGFEFGQNNVVPLFEIDKKGRSQGTFNGRYAYVDMQLGEWIKISRNGWYIGAGRGSRNYAEGNSDAAQVWLDIRSNFQPGESYHPRASYSEIFATWYGIGRKFTFDHYGVKGKCDIFIRYLSSGKSLIAGLDGTVQGDTYNGMVKTLSSGMNSGEYSEGKGFTLDARMDVPIGDNYNATLAIENLYGRINWDGIEVNDVYVTSPNFFEDPEGFMHDYGGAEGATWNQKVSFQIKPSYRLEFSSMKNVKMLAGFGFENLDDIKPDFGVVLPVSKSITSYFRIYPAQKRLEIGLVNTRFKLIVSGDDWLLAYPYKAGIAASITPLRF